MRKIRRAKLGFILVAITLVLEGCISGPMPQSATLGKSEDRNVVILGEWGKDAGTANYYADKYNAGVLYKLKKPNCGFLCEATSGLIRNTFHTSSVTKHVANELKSINHTEGEWTLIIPSFAERHFLLALYNMEDGSLSNAKVTVRLVDSSKNEAIEAEVERISKGKMAVKYG